MKKITGSFLMFALILLLNGCDEWDDFVDSISGSGDDNPAPVAEVTATEPKTEVAPVPEREVSRYETRFHHTSTGSSDGGKSLIMCPGEKVKFDKCSSGGVNIPYRGRDEGRITYWNMFEEPAGDIVCTKNGKTYRYKANRRMVYGRCS